MEYCEYCGDRLPQVGMTVVLCCCEESRANEIETRQRRVLWRQQRAEAVEKQRKLRRRQRRLDLNT